jgi:hypothetical protein
MSVGYIYILSNPAMPELLKIGFTVGNVEERVRQLSAHSGVPNPFEIEYFCLTLDVEEVEEKTHIHFSSRRVQGREFFLVPVAEAVTLIDLLVKPIKPHRFCRFAVPVPPKHKRPVRVLVGDSLAERLRRRE